MSACVSVWQLNAQEEDLPAVPYVKAAVMRLFEDDPQGYTKRLDTAFSVQNIVEELHYQHSDEAVRTVLNDMSGRARSPSSSSATRAGRTTTTSSAAAVAVLRAVSLRSETAPLACGSWRACV